MPWTQKDCPVGLEHQPQPEAACRHSSHEVCSEQMYVGSSGATGHVSLTARTTTAAVGASTCDWRAQMGVLAGSAAVGSEEPIAMCGSRSADSRVTHMSHCEASGSPDVELEGAHEPPGRRSGPVPSHQPQPARPRHEEHCDVVHVPRVL